MAFNLDERIKKQTKTTVLIADIAKPLSFNGFKALLSKEL